MIFLKNGLWLSVPTTVMLFLLYNGIPAGKWGGVVFFFVHATGFPLDLITIIYAIISDMREGGSVFLVLCFHFIAASINGAWIKAIFPCGVNNNIFKYSLFAMLTIFLVSSVVVRLIF